jgi:hypothetical protein
MSTRSYLVFGLALTAAAAASQARAGRELVTFPETFAEGVRYATVTRGNIKEDIFTSQAAIDAAKADKPLPSGSVITLVDYRDGKLFRYVVMEKRTGWGAEYPPERRNGEWEYQAFNADKIGEPERRHRPLFRLSQAERAAGVCAHLPSNEAFAISPELDMLNRTRQMRRVVIAALGLGLLTSQPVFSAPAPAVNGNVPSVAPALDKYLQGPVAALWQRPELSLRDRSIVTLAALIARNATADTGLPRPGPR